jgi:hypothetical protein
MSRRLGIAPAVFTERALKASEHDPEKWNRFSAFAKFASAGEGRSDQIML